MWDEPTPASLPGDRAIDHRAYMLRLHRRRQRIGIALIAAVIIGRDHLIGAAIGVRAFHDGLSHFAVLVVLLVAATWALSDLYERFASSPRPPDDVAADTQTARPELGHDPPDIGFASADERPSD